RFREARAHRNHHDIAAPHQLAGGDDIACARLKSCVAKVLAVIDDGEREGTVAIRLEDRRLELDTEAVPDENDALVEGLVERRLLRVTHTARERCGQDDAADYLRRALHFFPTVLGSPNICTA